MAIAEIGPQKQGECRRPPLPGFCRYPTPPPTVPPPHLPISLTSLSPSHWHPSVHGGLSKRLPRTPLSWSFSVSDAVADVLRRWPVMRRNERLLGGQRRILRAGKAGSLRGRPDQPDRACISAKICKLIVVDTWAMGVAAVLKKRAVVAGSAAAALLKKCARPLCCRKSF